MKKISVKKLIGVILSVIVTTVIIWTFWANTALELNTYKVYNPSSKNNSTMIVSRGICNSLFPLRFNNRPEVVLIELIKEK